MTTALGAELGVREIADAAVTALHDEVDLTPKPGLVDRRGSGAHDDMTRDMLHASAEALHPALAECACAAEQLAAGPALRARIGVIGRDGERAMLAATGGVNTHRGALWALGLLSAATGAGMVGTAATVTYAAQLARLPDPASGPRPGTAVSHGALARKRYHAGGAPGQARAGFPHITRYALPALRSGPDRTQARLHALLALMAHLDDTCLLHRGGPTGLAAVQAGARAVLRSGGLHTPEGRQHFTDLDRLCAARRLSPGGAGDLLAAALFLDTLDCRSTAGCKL